MHPGEKIQTLRKRAGISQEELAERIGVSRQSVSKWENGAALPETDKIIQIGRLFGISVNSLLSDEPLPAEDETALTEETETEAAAPTPRMPPEQPDPAEGTETQKKSRPQPKSKKLLPVLSVIGIVIGVLLLLWAVGVFASPGITPVPYPFVLVHGMGGWGDGSGMNGAARYWGTDTGDLAEYLRGEGYEVYTPTVGPISSAWDRACELYAVLTGTRVDYGAAHAAAHGHNRFGRTYAEPMLPQWDGKHKVNLVGHSFGGETVRLLTSLLAYGDEAEQKDGAADLSPLFTGGKKDWVYSVTTLCSPHNGSSLTCVLDSLGGLIGVKNTTELAARLCFAAAGIANPVNGAYDFMLDQFGITDPGSTLPEITAVLGTVFDGNSDNAGYDLTPDGARELNGRIRMADNVYYFSYAWCTTEPGTLANIQKPISSTLPVLIPFALAMGSYNGRTAGGIRIDETWQPNDGLVSVISAQCPAGDPQVPLNADAPQKGVWNVAPVETGHHGTVIGLGAGAEETHAFYDTLFLMINETR